MWTAKPEYLVNKNEHCYVDFDYKTDLGVWETAGVRWDGCINLVRYFNNAADDESRKVDDCDVMHICDIDETIQLLQELKAAAIEYYGEWWPDYVDPRRKTE